MDCRRHITRCSTFPDLRWSLVAVFSSASRPATRNSISPQRGPFSKVWLPMVFTMSRSSPIRIGSVCRTARRSWLPPVCFALSLLSGCRLDMHLQPKYNPEVPSNFFSDGRSARQPVTGTVARGQLRTDELLYAGKSDGNVADIFPFAIGTAELARGRERFNIYCSPCHGYAGYGDGMIVQ